mmetsp:Transcript_56660/g.90226  ORF Transcript_56660/g.90226 Transcript_56660/m.90226 type:complete len:120 (+) Transcript_56660:57-416(+)
MWNVVNIFSMFPSQQKVETLLQNTWLLSMLALISFAVLLIVVLHGRACCYCCQRCCDGSKSNVCSPKSSDTQSHGGNKYNYVWNASDIEHESEEYQYPKFVIGDEDDLDHEESIISVYI